MTEICFFGKQWNMLSYRLKKQHILWHLIAADTPLTNSPSSTTNHILYNTHSEYMNTQTQTQQI